MSARTCGDSGEWARRAARVAASGVPLRSPPSPNHQPVRAEGLPVEEHRGPQPGLAVELAPLALRRQGCRLHAQLRQQSARDRAVGARAVDLQRAAVHQQGTAAPDPRIHLELVALGVAAEVVVVLQHQDARVRTRLAPEVRCRQAADPPAHHHQVVGLAGVLKTVRVQVAIAQGMGGLEAPRMAAAHPGAGRRIIARRILVARLLARRFGGPGEGVAGPAESRRRADAEGHAVQEIAAVDPAHASNSPTARWAWSIATSV